MKTCADCKTTKPLSEFYKRTDRNVEYAICKLCQNARSLNRKRSLKIAAVMYKGGKCELCGYKRYVGALEFHHKDPQQKDFQLSVKTKNNLTDEIKKELDKCVLLCSNCHKEIHALIRGQKIKYKRYTLVTEKTNTP